MSLLGTRLACAAALLAFAGAAHAEDTELWPELTVYKSLSDTTRLYLDLTHTRGLESRAGTLEASAALDVSIRPFRYVYQEKDWKSDRYLWARIGYTRISDLEFGARETSEDRIVLAAHSRYPLPEEIWVEARLRADLRWVGEEYSTRYRFKLEASRDFLVLGHVVMPYANVEWFYDESIDAHSRTTYMAGTEAKLTPHFRVEGYLVWQYTRVPQPESTRALGLVAKWYF